MNSHTDSPNQSGESHEETDQSAPDEVSTPPFTLQLRLARQALANNNPEAALCFLYPVFGLKPHSFHLRRPFLPSPSNFSSKITEVVPEASALLLVAAAQTGQIRDALAVAMAANGLVQTVNGNHKVFSSASDWLEVLEKVSDLNLQRGTAARLARWAREGVRVLRELSGAELIEDVVGRDTLNEWFEQPHLLIDQPANAEALAEYLAGEPVTDREIATLDIDAFMHAIEHRDGSIPEGAVAIAIGLAHGLKARSSEAQIPAFIKGVFGKAVTGSFLAELERRRVQPERAVELALFALEHDQGLTDAGRAELTGRVVERLAQLPPTARKYRERLLGQAVEWALTNQASGHSRENWPVVVLCLDRFPGPPAPREASPVVELERGSAPITGPTDEVGADVLAAGESDGAPGLTVSAAGEEEPRAVGAFSYDELSSAALEAERADETLPRRGALENTPRLPGDGHRTLGEVVDQSDPRLASLLGRYPGDPERPVVLLGFQPVGQRLLVYTVEASEGNPLRWRARALDGAVDTIQRAVETFDGSIARAWQDHKRAEVPDRSRALADSLLHELGAHLAEVDDLLSAAVSDLLAAHDPEPNILLTAAGAAQALPLDLLTVRLAGGSERPLVHCGSTVRWTPGLVLQERMDTTGRRSGEGTGRSLGWLAYLPEHDPNGRFGGFFREKEVESEKDRWSPGAKFLQRTKGRGCQGTQATAGNLRSYSAGQFSDLLVLAHGCWDRGAVVLWDELVDSLGAAQLDTLFLVSCTIGRLGWSGADEPISHSLLSNILEQGSVSHLLAFRHTIPDTPAVKFALRVREDTGRDLALARSELLKSWFPNGSAATNVCHQHQVNTGDAFERFVGAVSIAYSAKLEPVR
ncbi:hypothetical protein GobsT_25770 [Gemmata obscuriglobus]|uniref:hypothetical protein n=1 Tax=Gemmata obscuriglobus TaxID=114 RepID=UPI0002DF691C|nr:hypothetical protein [Gemmata obscuriglobus]QEG27813.1 hypothetical protein GobsT_25770 [Gemmata obscuriglobus]VTS05152.1 unnamed protein product [Gemmata obscuriglobus UQM 2246]